MSTLLHSLIDLIKIPNCDDALESDIAQLYKTDINAYNKKAREWVKKYAAPVKK
jgi:ubiquitin-protein ligase